MQAAALGLGSVLLVQAPLVTAPVVGSVLGIVVLGETLPPGNAGWLVLVVAVAVMVVATAALARGQAAGATKQLP